MDIDPSKTIGQPSSTLSISLMFLCFDLLILKVVFIERDRQCRRWISNVGSCFVVSLEDMEGSSSLLSLVPSLAEFDSFVGECLVKNLTQLFEVVSPGAFIVPVSYEGVAEGIDMWSSDSGSGFHPRFRLKLDVKDDTGCAIFVLYDGLVKTLAAQSCEILSGMEESSSLYPDDMKIQVGDAALFKVEMDAVLSDIDSNCFRVLDMKIEPRVVDLFFEKFYPFSLSKSPPPSHIVSRGGRDEALNDYVDAAEVVDCPKEVSFLSNDVAKACFDSKFEKGKFPLLVGEVEGMLNNHIAVDVVVDTSKGSLVSPKCVDRDCFAVKNAKRKLSFLDEDAGINVPKKNKLFHFI